MSPNEDPVIALCWVIFFVVWIVSAFFTKPTAERAGMWTGWGFWVTVAVFMFARRSAQPFSPGIVLWHVTPTLRIVADAITGAGVFVAVWARAVLGRNWSANVVFKQQHELIERGPYRFVRHPIYTGVILMVLGTAITVGRIVGVIVVGVSIIGLSVKAHREERLLTKHLPEAYRRYRARVRAAIIPFVI